MVCQSISGVRGAPRTRRTAGAAALLIGAAALLLLLAGPRPALAWRASLNGIGQATDDFWNAVAYDVSGDLFVAGVSIYPGSDYECGYVVARLAAATGAELWRTVVPDCGSDETVSRSAHERLLVDPAGDVVVGRRGLGHDRSFVVYKYSGGTGEILWSVRVGGYPKHGPFVHATALDGEGNVIVGGGLDPLAPFCITDLVVAKLDRTTGAELWRKALRGSFEPDDSCEDEAYHRASAVAADGSGDVIAVGLLLDAREPEEGEPLPASPNPVRHGIVLKLSGEDGAEIWRVDSSVPELWVGLAPMLEVGADGDFAHIGAGFQVIKRSGATGQELWSYTPAAAAPFDEAYLLDLADDGDVAVTGVMSSVSFADPFDITTIKLDGANGAERWSKITGGSFGGNDSPTGLATDASGNVLLTGNVKSGENEADMLVAELAAADGAELWRLELDGVGVDPPADEYPHFSDDAGAVAVRGAQVAAVGSLFNGMTGQDGITLLLTATGDEVWREVLSDHQLGKDRALAATVAPGGDVVAAGGMERESGESGFVVHRFADTTGATVWSRELGDGEASTVGVDAAGEVIAAGRLARAERAGAPDAVTVVKLSGDDGEEMWRFALGRHYVPESRPVPLGLAPAGDVFVAATRSGQPGSFTTFVWRLSREDGAKVWRRKIRGVVVDSMAVDAAGNVVVYGSGNDQLLQTVVKLDGGTGAKLWRAPVPIGVLASMAVSPEGAVVLAGQLSPFPGTFFAGTLQLDGATGAEAWRDYLGTGYDVKVAVTPAGDVFTTMSTYKSVPGSDEIVRELVAARVLGSTGERSWLHVLDGAELLDCGASALASDAAGNALIGGCAESGYGYLDTFSVTKLAAATGAILWRRTLPSVGGELVQDPRPVAAFALDGKTNVVAAGATDNEGEGADFTVVKWNVDNGNDLVAPADRRCQKAIANAGRDYLLDRLDVLQRCRDKINQGVFDLVPSACPDEQATRTALERYGRRARTQVARSCAAELPAGVSCATSLDSLVSEDGSGGCLIETHDGAVGQALDAEYGPPMSSAPTEAVECQMAIGDRGRRYMSAALAAFRECLTHAGSVAVCHQDDVVGQALRKAGVRMRAKLEDVCGGSLLSVVAPCATTLDGLVDASGAGGCLVDSHDAAVEAAAEAQY